MPKFPDVTVKLKYYSTNRDTCRAWLNCESEGGRSSSGNLYFEGDVIYSYGEHFPLAVKIPNSRHIVVNGDKYSVTTSQHQGILFSKIHSKNRIEIPFSSLAEVYRKYYRPIGTVLSSVKFTQLDRVAKMMVKNIRVLDKTDSDWIETGRYNSDGEELYRHVLGKTLFEWEGKLFLSGMDETGARFGLYYLTELSHMWDSDEIRTIADALESLKPPAVKIADTMGVPYKRQGEWFFIPLDRVKKFIHDVPFDNPDKDVKLKDSIIKRYVLKSKYSNGGESHYATRGFEYEDKQFVKGTVRHNLGDHLILRLYDIGVKESEKEWFMAVENMQTMSWSASGAVD